MRYTSTYKNVKISFALDTYIQEAFEKFEDYFGRDFSCHATISKIRENDLSKTVEITIKCGKLIFRAAHTSDSFHKSVDEVYEKIKKQIRRNKDKTLAKKRDGKVDVKLKVTSISSDSEIETEKEVLVFGDNEYTIEKRKSVSDKPMNIEDAIALLNKKGYVFLPFINSETDAVTIVYRIGDGYGIIE
jgi:putative sigma-54 modulation protein